MVRRAAAATAKAGTGTLPADTIKELSSLQQRLSDTKYSSYLTSTQLVAQTRGKDPSKTPVLAQDGKSVVTLDKAQMPKSQQPPAVGDTKAFPNGQSGKWDGKGWVKQ
jgi:hypothetical protein